MDSFREFGGVSESNLEFRNVSESFREFQRVWQSLERLLQSTLELLQFTTVITFQDSTALPKTFHFLTRH